ncbi:MAG TPA: FAD-dependent monooxygenase, partial [Thermomicrobiales bacterium]|nr:FAD-dependent monooxygenase [Thermomicrobiales bacterium]
LGWVVPDLLAAVAAAPTLYADVVAQSVVPLWSAGRVTLAGDAAGCVSLLAGQGASLAMAEAYALAAALAEAATVPDALVRYEARVRPTVDRTQAGGRRLARWFVPATRGGVAARDLLTRLSLHPLLTPLARRQVGGGRAAPL